MMSDRTLKSLKSKPNANFSKFAVGGVSGLYVFVYPTGTKIFKFLKHNSWYKIGNYKNISLSEARLEAVKLSNDIEKGLLGGNETLENCFLKYKELKLKRQEWTERTAKFHNNILYKWIFSHPSFKTKSINNITKQEIIKALSPLDNDGKASTINKAFQSLSGSYEYAIARGYTDINLIKNINKSIVFTSKPKNDHFKTITNKAELKEFKDVIYKAKITNLSARNALKLMLFCPLRSKEIVSLKWEYVKDNMAYMPADIMKEKTPFIAIFSTYAVEILKNQKETMKYLNLDSEFVFYSKQNTKISDEAINKEIKKIGFGNKLTAHGIRSIFSTFCNENIQDHKYSEKIIDMCLAHKQKGEVEEAYNRAERLDERAGLMQWWGDWLIKI